MPIFKYKVAGKSGKPFDYFIDAENQREATRKLRSKELILLKSCGETDSLTTGKKNIFLKKKSFNAIEFTNRLVPLLQAHIQLEKALGIIEESCTEKGQKTVINDIRSGLHEGKKFSALVKSHKNNFSPLYASLIEVGEETGALADVMRELGGFLNYKKELKEFLITNSIYPAIILFVTIAVIILMFSVFIPRFSRIFMDMGKALPLPTQIMFSLSNFINKLWWLWFALIASGTFLLSRIQKDKKIKAWWNRNILNFPLIGKLIQALEIGRFIKTLSVLLKNEVHLLNSVRIASNVIQNTEIAQSFSNVTAELKSGTKLSKALKKSKYMPQIAIQMLSIGEESGNMGGMLEQIANQQELITKTKIKRILSFFEPIVILLLSGVVLSVVITIFLAIMGMNEI